jgi:GT2 family glycosyltransferase
MPYVSIIIPTYNRLPRLKRVLAALERQTIPLDQFEVIVVSDGSTDGTTEYLANIETPLRLVPLMQSNRGVAAARNHGVERASGELLLFLDDDVVPVPELVAEHLRALAEHAGEVVVLGPMLTPEDGAFPPWVCWEQAMLERQYEDMTMGRYAPTARQFYTGNTSLARRHVVAAGGFDERFRRAEDVELAYRLAERGLRFVFRPAAASYHYADRSYASWFEIPYVYGRNDVIFTRDKGQSWLLPVVLREFHERNPLVRLLVRGCLGRRLPSRLALAGLKRLADAGGWLRLVQVPRASYSAIFNLRYYQGVADELGGRRPFFARIDCPAEAITSSL